MSTLSETLLDQLNRAIRERNETRVRAVLTQGAKGQLHRDEDMPAAHAVEQRHLPILQAVAAHFNGKGLAMAYAYALDTEWRTGADALWTAGQAKPIKDQLYRIVALKEAAKFGFHSAANQLLDRMGRRIKQESGGGVGVVNPLTTAAMAQQVGILKTLLSCEVDPVLCDDALEMAVLSSHPECVELLWPRAQTSGRAKAILALAEKRKDQWPSDGLAMADWMATQVTVQALEGGTEKDIGALQQAFTGMARHGHMPFLRALQPLIDPAAHQAEALRAAVTQTHADAIRFLLPFSDPQVARKFWLTRNPPQWEPVDQLSLYLSPDLQKAWARDLTQMPRLKAVQRAEKTAAHPPKTAQRRRLRS